MEINNGQSAASDVARARTDFFKKVQNNTPYYGNWNELGKTKQVILHEIDEVKQEIADKKKDPVTGLKEIAAKVLELRQKEVQHFIQTAPNAGVIETGLADLNIKTEQAAFKQEIENFQAGKGFSIPNIPKYLAVFGDAQDAEFLAASGRAKTGSNKTTSTSDSQTRPDNNSKDKNLAALIGDFMKMLSDFGVDPKKDYDYTKTT